MVKLNHIYFMKSKTKVVVIGGGVVGVSMLYHLAKKYSKKPVKAVVVPIPFTRSFNENTREAEVLAVLNK